MTTPAGVYPFATASGDSIPVDVIKPVSLALLTLPAATTVSIVLPAGTSIVSFVSDIDSVARLGSTIGAPVSGTFYSDTLYIPANVVVLAQLSPGTLYCRSLAIGGGTLKIQLVEQWSSLGIPLQYGIR